MSIFLLVDMFFLSLNIPRHVVPLLFRVGYEPYTRSILIMSVHLLDLHITAESLSEGTE